MATRKMATTRSSIPLTFEPPVTSWMTNCIGYCTFHAQPPLSATRDPLTELPNVL